MIYEINEQKVFVPVSQIMMEHKGCKTLLKFIEK
jgi:hypothetical protein